MNDKRRIASTLKELAGEGKAEKKFVLLNQQRHSVCL